MSTRALTSALCRHLLRTERKLPVRTASLQPRRLRFHKREQASRELAKIGPAARGQLQRALDEHPSLEVQQRAKALLSRMNPEGVSPDDLFDLRAIQVLAGLPSEGARELLERLAQASANDRVARHARYAVQRLAKKSRVR